MLCLIELARTADSAVTFDATTLGQQYDKLTMIIDYLNHKRNMDIYVAARKNCLYLS